MALLYTTATDTFANAIIFHYDVTCTAGNLISSAAKDYRTSDIFFLTSAIPPIIAIAIANDPKLLPDGSEKEFYKFCGVTSGIFILVGLVKRFIGHSKLEKAGEVLSGVRITNTGISIDL